MIYLTREGDYINNNSTITWLTECDTRHCTTVQCCRVAWYFLLFVLLPQIPVVLCIHVEYGEAGGRVCLLPALAGGGDVLLPAVAGGGLVPLPAVVAGNGHIPLLALAGGGDVPLSAVAGNGLVLACNSSWLWTCPSACTSVA